MFSIYTVAHNAQEACIGVFTRVYPTPADNEAFGCEVSKHVLLPRLDDRKFVYQVNPWIQLPSGCFG